MSTISNGFIASEIQDILYTKEMKRRGNFMSKKIITEKGKKKQVEIKRALSSLILSPGDKFEVINPQMNNSFPPGTMGYFSYVQGRSEYGRNSLNVNVTTLRRGKGGKPRLESDTMVMPIFHEKHTVLDYSLKRDSESLNYFVLQRRIPVFVNLLTAEPEDFLGWCLSYTNFLHFLSKTTDFKKIWPSGKDRLNRLLHLSSEWTEHNDVVMEKYSNIEVRERAITSLRKMETKLYRRVLKYNLYNADHKLFSIREYVSPMAPNDKYSTLTKECIKQTNIKHEEGYTDVRTQYNKSKTKQSKVSWRDQHRYTNQEPEEPEEEVAPMLNPVTHSSSTTYANPIKQDVTFDWGRVGLQVNLNSDGNMEIDYDEAVINLSEDFNSPQYVISANNPEAVKAPPATYGAGWYTDTDLSEVDDAPELPPEDDSVNEVAGYKQPNYFTNEVDLSNELVEEPLTHGPEWDDPELEEDHIEDEDENEVYPPDNNIWTTKLEPDDNF